MELHLDSERRERAASTIRARGFDVTVRQDPTMAGTDIHMVYAVRPASGGMPRITATMRAPSIPEVHENPESPLGKFWEPVK